LIVGQIVDEGYELVVTAHAHALAAACPLCGQESRRIHSRYLRQLADLPCAGRKVRLHIVARRFVCRAPQCPRRIFAERFGQDILASRSRRTARLECIVHHLGLALGGRPGAGLAKRLMLPVSNDTLLRVVRRRAGPYSPTLKVVGVDDWALRRTQRYGTIVCDLERRRVVTLLPDREAAAVAAWFGDHPDVKIVSRDRGGGYGEAASKALPGANQVADRWHLVENASAAFLDAVLKSMRTIRTALGAARIDPDLLTAAEKRQYEGYLRREDANASILELSADGVAIKEIVRRSGHSRKLVRHVVRGLRTDVFRTRQSSLEPHLPFLDEQWFNGCRNGAELWRRVKTEGYTGCRRVVGEWTTRRRRSEIAGEGLRKIPSARTIARMMAMARDHLSKADTVTVAAVETGAPDLVAARTLVDRFFAMVRTKAADDLGDWIASATKSLTASFAGGVAKDKAAIDAGITQPWSNGQTEGQISRLKMVKRQMYGQGKLDLLQARLIGAE